MNLKHLTDKTLLLDTKFLVGKEREYLTKILHHLQEIDRRRLYCDLRYGSLFEYCVKELGYSEGSAQRRIQACRMLNVVPEIEEKLEDGLLTLSNVSLAAQFFNQHNIQEPEDKRGVLVQIEGLTAKETEKRLFEISGDEIKVKEQDKRISSEEIKVIFVITDDTMEKFDYLKGLFHKTLSKSELFEKMLDISIQQMKKKKFKIG